MTLDRDRILIRAAAKNQRPTANISKLHHTPDRYHYEKYFKGKLSSTCLDLHNPRWRNWFCISQLMSIVAIGLCDTPLLRQKQASLLMYDVNLTLSCRCWLFIYGFSGSKYLEYISSIRTMNNN
jgi:hypothetical protein